MVIVRKTYLYILVGPQAQKQLISKGINTIGLLDKYELSVIKSSLGKLSGIQVWNLANGIENLEVKKMYVLLL